uniref:Reverse transcriptase Ty1/copia-type domain-containing protein n=1 Tax=Tanacetum cinerariifolium TaxID=118510 RepID=A0A6L2MHX5_TANCI|nr:hypothetical protein [Tanacetum cinerariifolium]
MNSDDVVTFALGGLPAKSHEQDTLVDASSSSPMVLLANSSSNVRCSLSSMEKPVQINLTGQQGSSGPTSHETILPRAFTAGTLQDPTLADGTHSRYIARLIANGSTQIVGIDLDIKNSFLHGDLTKTVYMHQLLRQGTGTAYLLLYVDDIVLTASSELLLQQIITFLHQEFSMMDLGSFNYFLGISITHDSTRIFLYQRKYATEILERAHMIGCNPSLTLFDNESKIGDDVYLRMHGPSEPYSLALKQILRAVYLSFILVQHQRIKHIEIDIHFVLDLIVAGQVRVLHVPSRYQYADVFTKGLPTALFEEFCFSLSVWCPPA